MRAHDPHRLVRRLDALFLVGLLVTSGVAALLLWTQLGVGQNGADAAAPAAAMPEDRLVPDAADVSVPPSPVWAPTLGPDDSILPAMDDIALGGTPVALQATRPPNVTLQAGDLTPQTLPGVYVSRPVTLSGKTQPGYAVEVDDGEELLGSTIAGLSGLWSLDLPLDLPAGDYVLTILVLDLDGEEVQTSQIALTLGPAPATTGTVTPADAPASAATATRTTVPTAADTRAPAATITATPSDTPVPPTATATPSDTPVPPTATATPSDTPVPPTATATPSDTPVPPTATITPFASPEFLGVPAQVLAREPVVIEGQAEPGQNVIVTANDVTVGIVTVEPDGSWSITWEASASGEVMFEAIVVNGDENVSSPAVLRVEVLAAPPRITAPESGEFFSPGPVTVRGTAQPGAVVTLRDQEGVALATVDVPADGVWETSVTLAGDGAVTLVAEGQGPDGTIVMSDPVVIQLAPPVQPESGGILTANPDDTGRAFTVLLALLLAAGGFSAYFAGRLLMMLARDQLKPR